MLKNLFFLSADMSFHRDSGGPRGGMPPGQHSSAQTFRPTNMRTPPPQPHAPPYHYDPQATPSSGYHGGYMPPDFMHYPPPAPPQTPGSVSQCPVRPPFPKSTARQGFQEPPPNFPPPPLPSSAGGPGPRVQVSAHSSYHPFMMPPPPLPRPPMPPPISSQSMNYNPPYPMNYPPFPPPTFMPSYSQSPGPFQPDHSARHGGQFKYEKPPESRRSPERSFYQDGRQKSYCYSGERRKMEFSGDRKDHGRSPDRNSRPEGGRYRSPLRPRSRYQPVLQIRMSV